jgi:hypothetical protein
MDAAVAAPVATIGQGVVVDAVCKRAKSSPHGRVCISDKLLAAPPAEFASIVAREIDHWACRDSSRQPPEALI